MKIVLIGTGNVATVLGKRLLRAGHAIVQVYGRSTEKAAELATKLGGNCCSLWEDIDPAADLYLVAISDVALPDLSRHLRLNGQVVLHTAGAVPMDVLKEVSANHGVLYPLQSLRSEVELLTEIPFLGEGSNTFTRDLIAEIVISLGAGVTFVTGAERLRLHVAAVCINNFGNHIFALTADFCRREHVDFKLLAPIALETAKRISVVTPQSVVTGPAMRNDVGTIEKHLELLENDLLLQQVYRQMTDNIRVYYETTGG